MVYGWARPASSADRARKSLSFLDTHPTPGETFKVDALQCACGELRFVLAKFGTEVAYAILGLLRRGGVPGLRHVRPPSLQMRVRLLLRRSTRRQGPLHLHFLTRHAVVTRRLDRADASGTIRLQRPNESTGAAEELDVGGKFKLWTLSATLGADPSARPRCHGCP